MYDSEILHTELWYHRGYFLIFGINLFYQSTFVILKIYSKIWRILIFQDDPRQKPGGRI